MSNKRITIALAAMAVCTIAMAQTRGNKSFDDFRKSVLSGYNEYRSQVLSNYAKFLNGIWDDYEQFKAESRDSKPKPVSAPDVAETPPLPIPQEPLADEPLPEEPAFERPAPVDPSKAQPVPNVDVTGHGNDPLAINDVKVPEGQKPQPAEPRKEGGKRSNSGLPGFLPQSPSSKPFLPDLPPVAYQPRPKVEEEPDGDGFKFDYYEMKLEVPMIDFNIKNSLASNNDYGTQWSELASKSETKALVKELSKLSKELNLNDYLTYELTKQYVKAKYPRANASSRVSLVHYLLANMGYDVRLGTGANGEVPMILMPTQQMVYARPFLRIDEKQYFLFPEDDADLKRATKGISTCRLPKDADLGQKFDLRVSNLNIPYKAHPYSVQYGGMEIKGELNANVIPILYKYPQMPISDYAQSNICPDVRKDVTSQIQSSLNGKPQKEAVNDLLHFVQKGFKYATDDENFGFEKPYFFEEMLYYDKCDCEDRSVFYTYLLWNALGVQNHIINYPGHESVAVRLDEPVNGSGYEYEGGKFNISDPTYIGASTGQCMPNYAKTAPEVDYIYK